MSDNSTESLAEFMGADVDRRRRIFAVSSLSNETPTARFVIRYNAAHATPISRYVNPGTTYDAFYLLAYAAWALGRVPIEGPALARTFARLVPPGKAIEVGPMALDFDLATGEAPSDFALVCPDVGADGSAAGDLESGVYYRAATKRIEGKVRCP